MDIVSAKRGADATVLVQLTGGRTLTVPESLSNADYRDLLASGVPIADAEPAPAVEPSFVARDLLDLLTTDDLAAIQTTIAGDASLDLLWLRMTGRGDKPISTCSPDFTAGWAGLTAALGQSRADELAASLGISQR
ncbi:MAG: hypothetical protein R3D62_01870 [Xanthobacteraceae bacterium]